MKNSEFVVVDIETTGLSCYKHRITEIAAQKICSGKVVDQFQTLINPEVPIPRFITKLTGINYELVKNAPKIVDVMPKFLKFIGNTAIVAHNATFDYGFLSYNAKELGLLLTNDVVCTRLLANRILPDLPSKRLSSLCEYFDINNEQAHRAMGDVKVTTIIFNKFIKMLNDNNITTYNDLLLFQRSPRYKSPFND